MGLQSIYSGAQSSNIGTVSGLKFDDVNANGIRDVGELGISNTEICLYSIVFPPPLDGTETIFGLPKAFAGVSQLPELIGCVLTGPDGNYQFSNLLVPGFYIVVETVVADKLQTFPTSSDCFFFGEQVPHCASLDFGSSDATGLDFGNTDAAFIHGQKLRDDNGDGIGDVPVPGVSIQACKIVAPSLECVSPDSVLTTFSTFTMGDDPLTPENEEGKFWLKVIPGDYKVEEFTFGTIQIIPANGAPYFVSLAAGQTADNLNFVNQIAPPGSIQGTKFNDQNQNGIRDPGENGIGGVEIYIPFTSFRTFTQSDGTYEINGLTSGTYRVGEITPAGSVYTTPRLRIVNVALGGTTTGIDFGNSASFPPPPEVTITPPPPHPPNQSRNIPTFFWSIPMTITKNVGPAGFDHCGTDQPVAINLVITFPETSGQRHQLMTQRADNPATPEDESEIWDAPFTPFHDPGNGSPHGDHGPAILEFFVDCPPDTAGFPEDPSLISAEDEIQKGGNIYIDPSGRVLNACTNQPIQGATVTLLQEFPPTSGTFIQTPSSTPPIIPDVNPQTTLADGAYGWVVIPGNYQVHATAPGYLPNQSSTLGIPPAVTDLDILLSPDADGDGTADICVPDSDDDGVPDDIDNCPAISNPDQTDSDGDDQGNACDTTPNGVADLSIQKTGPAQVTAGNIIQDTIVVHNQGPDTARNVIMTDPIPIEIVQLNLVSVQPATMCSVDEPNRLITCNLGDMAPDSFFDIFVDLPTQSNFDGTITNTASVSSDSSDQNNANDSSSASTTVVSSVDLFCGLPESAYSTIIDGTSGNDNLKGTNGDDLIRGFDGNDKISGKKGNDCLIGGSGNDRIHGGDGDDTIQGDEGDDRLSGNKGNDNISGGDGDDRIWGGKGMDTIDAGNGDDRVHANQDNDTVSGGNGDDWLGAGKGDDIVHGGEGNDKIFGRPGADQLFGDAGEDKIHGGQGDDHLDGGADTDKCHGGQGNNTFANCEDTKPKMSEEDDDDEGPEDE